MMHRCNGIALIACFLLGHVVLCSCYLPFFNLRRSRNDMTRKYSRCYATLQNGDEYPTLSDGQTSRRRYLTRVVVGISAAISTGSGILPQSSVAEVGNGNAASGGNNGMTQQPKNKRIGGLASKIRGITLVMVCFQLYDFTRKKVKPILF